MRRFTSYLLVALLGMAGGGAAMYAYMPVRAEMSAADNQGPMQIAAQPQIQRTVAGTPSIVGTSTVADLVDKVDAAVVNIDTIARTRSQRDPFYDMFFEGEQPPEHEEKGVGSGFIIDANGLIVTNNHVVRGATEITVTMANGKRYTGKVVGTDPGTDLALVKVNATKLPALNFVQNDRQVRVGDWVVAIGSPLGLAHTVSVGIVSALNRGIAINERVNFIQTDAAINPGNSGGPLINMRGEVVGVNTAIAAQGQGIGFAIPAWTARNIVGQLRTTGKVVRPWLGVSIRDLEDGVTGVQIVGVVPTGPAAKGGLQAGDVIIKVDQQVVKDSRDLLTYLNNKGVGTTVAVTVRRGNGTRVVQVKLDSMPAQRMPNR
jgi:S1-C subfamily serine protease